MDFWKASKICEYVFLFLCYMTLFTNFIFHFYFHIAFLIPITPIAAYCHQFPSCLLPPVAAYFHHQFPSRRIAVLPPISSRRNCRITAHIITPGLPYCCPFHHAGIAVLPPTSITPGLLYCR